MTNLDTQAVRDFKKAVTAAKNRRHMFWRSQAPGLAYMLNQALEQLKQSVSDPQIGVDTLIGFYKRDVDIFERCDEGVKCQKKSEMTPKRAKTKASRGTESVYFCVPSVVPSARFSAFGLGACSGSTKRF